MEYHLKLYQENVSFVIQNLPAQLTRVRMGHEIDGLSKHFEKTIVITCCIHSFLPIIWKDVWSKRWLYFSKYIYGWRNM